LKGQFTIPVRNTGDVILALADEFTSESIIISEVPIFLLSPTPILNVSILYCKFWRASVSESGPCEALYYASLVVPALRSGGKSAAASAKELLVTEDCGVSGWGRDDLPHENRNHRLKLVCVTFYCDDVE